MLTFLPFQIVKNRFSGDLGIVPLFFNRGTLTFSKRIFQRERSAQRKRRESAPSKSELAAAGVPEEDSPPREVLVSPTSTTEGGGVESDQK